ncbi:MAG: hypothetical protein WC605_07160 [Bacteroidales bacterium]
MISDYELKKLLQEGKESYNEQKLEKMIELIKSLCHLDYEFQKRRKYDK